MIIRLMIGEMISEVKILMIFGIFSVLIMEVLVISVLVKLMLMMVLIRV